MLWLPQYVHHLSQNLPEVAANRVCLCVYMYLCVCVCVYVCLKEVDVSEFFVYVCMYVCMCVCMHMSVLVCIYCM
jgi:hypothetical protein